MMGSLALRMGFWFLLTADLGIQNTLMGLAASLLIPRTRNDRLPVRKWTPAFLEILKAIPLAYAQAFDMMVRPHRKTIMDRQPLRSGRHPLMIFLEIFRITFTPKTIATRVDDRRRVAVHHLARRKRS